jgi:hypothetical protein
MAAAALGSAWGAALLGRPHDLLARTSGRRPGSAEVVVARLLGVRQVVQAVALHRWPVRAARWCAAVDALHGASMVLLATLSPRHRRPALLSAGVAGVLALLELAGSRA